MLGILNRNVMKSYQLKDLCNKLDIVSPLKKESPKIKKEVYSPQDTFSRIFPVIIDLDVKLNDNVIVTNLRGFVVKGIIKKINKNSQQVEILKTNGDTTIIQANMDAIFYIKKYSKEF